MNSNSTGLMFGVVVGLVLGGIGGYAVGQNGGDEMNIAQVQRMTDMMKTDGAQMEKMGGMMMSAGAMLEDRGVKYNDQAMVMMGKDLSANGMKHQKDGQSMVLGDMMGMTADGNMRDMPGMEMEGMDHSKM